MKQALTGFRRDDAGEWVAELSCGHDQHMRHRPPFQLREWVLSPEGRAKRACEPVECPLCDRCERPASAGAASTAKEYDETTVPGGLRRAHRLGKAVWGRLTVLDGLLACVIETTPALEVVLSPGESQDIPPTVRHRVEPLGRVRFVLEIFPVVRPSPPEEGGDPACWARLVCPDCGAVAEGTSSDHRPGCPARSGL